MGSPSALHPQAADVPADPDPLFTGEDLWFAGGFVAGTIAMFPLDRRLALALQDSTAQANELMQRSLDLVGDVGRPGTFIAGSALYVAGLLSGNDRMEDLGLHGTEAVIFADLITRAVKGLAGRGRPPVVGADDPSDFDLLRGFGEQDYQSFPSGHAAVAFAAAAAVTAETEAWWPDWKPAIGGVMYGGAALVALSRMYNNRHWASDVVAGAAIGSFSGWKIVRYTQTHPDNNLGRWLLPAGAAAVLYSTWRAREEDGEREEETGAADRSEAGTSRGALFPGHLSVLPAAGGGLQLTWSVPLP